MFPERILEQWLTNVFSLYAANPLMVEHVFQEEDHFGETDPANLTATVLTDTQKYWIPGVFPGSTLRYYDTLFPITANSAQTLTVTGNLLTAGAAPAPYQIIPADVTTLTSYLTSRPIPVQISYSRLPAQAPMIHLRLESDRQADAYIGENVKYVINPATAEVLTQLETAMEATYLATIFTQNPQETVWLYNLLINAYLGSKHYFASVGLANMSLTGSDVHPDVAYLPEHVYARYVHISFTRVMSAVRIDPIQQVTEIVTVPDPHYQELDSKMDPPLPGSLWHQRLKKS
jgi:hypothetical protein